MVQTVINVEFETDDVLASVIANLDYALKARPQSDGTMYKVILSVKTMNDERECYPDGGWQSVNDQEQAIHYGAAVTQPLSAIPPVASIRRLDTGEVLPFRAGVERFLTGIAVQGSLELELESGETLIVSELNGELIGLPKP